MSEIYIDRKYILLISSRLRNFKSRREDLYNFSCPYCGDSKRKTTKARGYIYRKSNDYFFRCHNCSVSTTFSKFLEFVEPQVYKDYVFERFVKDKKFENKSMEQRIYELPVESIHVYDFDGIDTLPDGHYAKEYIRNRKIPQEFWHEFVYTDKYKTWLDANFPQHVKKDLVDDARIITFYTSWDGTITNISGRALAYDNDLLRYITVKILDDERKVFGLHRLNPQNKVYVTEGQFDSLFLPNAVASGDSNLGDLGDHLSDKYGVKPILVFDNEPRNSQIVESMRKGLRDHEIVIFPDSFPGKDLNDAILSGLSQSDLLKIVEENTYSGLNAELRLSNWRRC
jgi:transcription elongation factor Elf1